MQGLRDVGARIAEGYRYFDDESEALEKYVRLLRLQQRLLDRGVI